jgi:competence protein ComGC
MKYRKKGFTLLEILAYLSISSVVLIISTKVLIDTRYIFFSSMNSIQNINCIESGLITIDSLVNDSQIKRIEANDNKVNLYYATNEGQIIKQLINDNNDLIIRYYKSNSQEFYPYTGHNDVISNIEDFKVIKKGKLIYLIIKKEGDTYIKSL